MDGDTGGADGCCRGFNDGVNGIFGGRSLVVLMVVARTVVAVAGGGAL